MQWPHSGLNNAYQTGRDPSENLAGTVIQSMREAGASGGRVVVTYQEGLTIGPNPDIVMDQLVGYHYLSQNYGVVRGIHSQNIDKEYFYVLAGDRHGTTIKVSDYGTFTLGPLEQKSFHMTGSRKTYTVESNEAIAVFHMSGTDRLTQSGQRGGALIPPLSSDKHCVGSKIVDFSRSKSHAEGYSYYLNLLAFVDPSDPDITSIGNFKLQKTVWSSTTPPTATLSNVSASSDEKALENYLNDINNWHTFDGLAPSSPLNKWRGFR